MPIVRVAAMCLLLIAGLSNLAAGAFAIFPAMMEIAIDPSGIDVPSDAPSEKQSSDVEFSDLIQTKHGAAAIYWLIVALLQLALSANLGWLTRSGAPMAFIPLTVALLGMLGELWGWHLKEHFSVFNGVGLLASAIVFTLSIRGLQGNPS